MTVFEIILLLVGVLVVLPITAYMVMKFGASGYFRAKAREKKKEK